MKVIHIAVCAAISVGLTCSAFAQTLRRPFRDVLPAPSAAELAEANAGLRLLFLEIPHREHYQAAYPSEALGRSVMAEVVIDCIVQPEGLLACRAGDDGLPQFDFESGALLIATRFRAAPSDRDGVNSEGARWRDVIVFQPGADWYSTATERRAARERLLPSN